MGLTRKSSGDERGEAASDDRRYKVMTKRDF